jgi:hypothetical protein
LPFGSGTEDHGEGEARFVLYNVSVKSSNVKALSSAEVWQTLDREEKMYLQAWKIRF